MTCPGWRARYSQMAYSVGVSGTASPPTARPCAPRSIAPPRRRGRASAAGAHGVDGPRPWRAVPRPRRACGRSRRRPCRRRTGILLGHASGQEDDGPVEVRADLPHELEAVEPRHHDVAEHAVGGREVHPGTAVGSAALTALMAVAAEDARKRVEDRPFIIHCQVPRHVRPPETPVGALAPRSAVQSPARAAAGATWRSQGWAARGRRSSAAPTPSRIEQGIPGQDEHCGEEEEHGGEQLPTHLPSVLEAARPGRRRTAAAARVSTRPASAVVRRGPAARAASMEDLHQSDPRRAGQASGTQLRGVARAPVSSPVMRPCASPPTEKNARSIPAAPAPMAALRPRRRATPSPVRRGAGCPARCPPRRPQAERARAAGVRRRRARPRTRRAPRPARPRRAHKGEQLRRDGAPARGDRREVGEAPGSALLVHGEPQTMADMSGMRAPRNWA